MIKKYLKRIPGAKKLAKRLGLIAPQPDPRAFLLKMLPKNSVGIEIGVHTGDFSARILQNVEPRELHLVDPWKHEESDTYSKALYGGKARGGQAEMDKRYQSVQQRFAQDIRMGRVKVHRAFSTEVLNEFPDSYFDWVYIDGNHLYEFVREDLILSFKKTKPDGYITGDDYEKEGWWQGGVKKAVDEFVRENPIEMVAVRHGQFVLHK